MSNDQQKALEAKEKFLQDLSSGHDRIDKLLERYGYDRAYLGRILTQPDVRAALEEHEQIQIQAARRILMALVPMAALRMSDIVMSGADGDALAATKTLFKMKMVGFLQGPGQGVQGGQRNQFTFNVKNMGPTEIKDSFQDSDEENPEDFEEVIDVQAIGDGK